MSDDCRKMPKLTDCSPGTDITDDAQQRECPTAEVCLPFGRTLTFDGQCVYVSGTPSVSDGTYNSLPSRTVVSHQLVTLSL